MSTDTKLYKYDACKTVKKYVGDWRYHLLRANLMGMILCTLMVLGLAFVIGKTDKEETKNFAANMILASSRAVLVMVLINQFNRGGLNILSFLRKFSSYIDKHKDVSAGVLDDFYGRECAFERPEIKNNFILAVTELAENDALFNSWLEQVKSGALYYDISIAIAKGRLQKNPSDIQRIFDAVGTEKLSDLKDFYNDIARTNKNVVPWSAAVAMHNSKQHTK